MVHVTGTKSDQTGLLTRDDYIAAAARGPADPRLLFQEATGLTTCDEHPGPGGVLRTYQSPDTPITLTMLVKLARLFLTEDISVSFQEGTDWGGETGSDPDWVIIELRGIRAELEWPAGGVRFRLINQTVSLCSR